MTKLKNLPASVKARLLNVARTRHETFNDILVRYCIERLLYRLGQSKHADRFLLKGALLFVLWDDRVPRPTRDVDFLGFGNMEIDAIIDAFREIIATNAPPDGLHFEEASVRAEEIREGQEYGGVRINITAWLGKARIPMQIDVGSGDAVTPAPEVTDFPVLLDFPPPRVRAYPIYTVVAEKFEAIVSIGPRNTRMKDFHDLWFLSRRFDFDGSMLHQALSATFRRRGTVMEGELLPFTSEYVNDAARQAQWHGFLGRNALKTPPDQFPLLMAELREFVGPALKSNNQRWYAGKGWE
ncbi:nucleotidyl transferase AbiEii/AbiGii toxin family protein [Ereboglobus luteus]|uniref:Nucleotidyl transferase AbiEii/AbiGii toxin family protein n=1 Tax=Ereboglobus luteus TaxID=1796921 RepID=A0A2U8E3Y5_9BACT|nr:nucleotidyl transferase AbiEii/AbiGii toxin family protein [Ereboglobus luteus]AWI09510.1 hypothetical protein CKA38_09875 [Ereboglobus luteus]